MFKSSQKKDEFEAFLENCKSEQDFKQVKAEDYFVEGYAFTMKKTTKKLIVTVLTEKEAKKAELKMKLKDRIYQKKNGRRDMQRKIRSERKNVDKSLFKKFMKVINSGQGGANVLSPSDIIFQCRRCTDCVTREAKVHIIINDMLNAVGSRRFLCYRQRRIGSRGHVKVGFLLYFKR